MPIEEELLGIAVKELLPMLRSTVETQLDSYNLVQREVDGRALNFYCIKDGRVKHDDIPPLPLKSGEVKLLSVTFDITGQAENMHMTACAVNGYFFCLAFSNDLRPYKDYRQIMVKEVHQSWRSNIDSTKK